MTEWQPGLWWHCASNVCNTGIHLTHVHPEQASLQVYEHSMSPESEGSLLTCQPSHGSSTGFGLHTCKMRNTFYLTDSLCSCSTATRVCFRAVVQLRNSNGLTAAYLAAGVTFNQTVAYSTVLFKANVAGSCGLIFFCWNGCSGGSALQGHRPCPQVRDANGDGVCFGTLIIPPLAPFVWHLLKRLAYKLSLTPTCRWVDWLLQWHEISIVCLQALKPCDIANASQSHNNMYVQHACVIAICFVVSHQLWAVIWVMHVSDTWVNVWSKDIKVGPIR